MRERATTGSVCSVLRSSVDPILVHRRRTVAAVALGGLLVAAALIWAVQPPAVVGNTTTTDHVALPSNAPATPRAPLDISGFAAVLWHVPAEAAPPSKPKVAAATSRPLRLQLIGITTEEGVRHAALYDLDADRLLIVAAGDRIGDHEVATVDDDAVELTDGQRTTRLALLEADRGGSS